MGESRGWSQTVLPIGERPVIELPPIEWSRLPACYRSRPAARQLQPAKPRRPAAGHWWTRQTLPFTAGHIRRILAADPAALAEELLTRFRARAGN
ncbi:MAG TPA: hypothetical protein VHV55_01105 [Pirellulales bacterium]|jgi:hypothetical protein|nr:hypothetical protein [Pirellulales bacterium]